MIAPYRVILVLLFITVVLTMSAALNNAAFHPCESVPTWLFGMSLVQIVLLVAMATKIVPAADGSRTIASSFVESLSDAEMPLQAPSPDRRTGDQWRSILQELGSKNQSVRCKAIQMLVDEGRSPLAGIECWPEQNCTDIQLQTAEVLLHEWVEGLTTFPNATDGDLIHLLFKPTPKEPTKPRVPKIARPDPISDSYIPPPQPEVTVLLHAALDRLNDVVKDTILDWKTELPATDEDPEEEIALTPLDRNQFAIEMIAKFEAVLEHLTDTIAASRTNLELARTEAEVGRFLHELRWDALNLALELRAPADMNIVSLSGTVSQPSLRQYPPEPAAYPSSGGWAKKYRRMKALGY